jgi:hypothetical protein
VRRLAFGLALVLAVACGTRTQQEAAFPTPVPTTVADLTVGGAVRDVGAALRKWDEFIYRVHVCTEFITTNCRTEAESDRVAVALRAYIAARPKGKVVSNDPSPASINLIIASRNLVVTIADIIERKR